MGNNLDLDSDKSDGVAFMGYALDTELTIKYKESLTAFIKLESDGPFDYDALIMSDNRINSLFGDIDNYSLPEILLRVEEYWIDTTLCNLPVKMKVGQYAYQVGNGYALGGYYEN